LIALRLPDFFLIQEIGEVPLFMVIIDIVLDNPLSNDIRVTVEVVQFDFMQEEVQVNVMTEVICV